MDWPLRFGIFLAPFHPVGQNPTLALERDLDLIVHLDALGFDEAWIGEHHSAGYEIIASPEVFIATAAERTRHIRLGTGVSSLPYHHPLMLADRIVLLDHLTRGRVMFGVGPGALPSDAFMMGIEVAKQRDMMEEALEAILLLLRSDEPVTYKTDWFTLNDARLQLRPYTHPHFEVAVAAQVSPSAAPGPPAASAAHCCRSARPASAASTPSATTGASWRSGRPSTAWRSTAATGASSAPCTSPTRRSRRTQTSSSASPSGSTTSSASPRCPWGPRATTRSSWPTRSTRTGFAVIGTPDDAIAQVQRLVDQSKGFGTFLLMAHEWADTAATRRSYELFSRYVAPVFQGSAVSTTGSRDWAAENRPTFMTAVGGAIMSAIAKHNDEREAKQAAATTG